MTTLTSKTMTTLTSKIAGAGAVCCAPPKGTCFFLVIRRVLFALLLALAVSFIGIRSATAAPPKVKTQAPGFYRMMLGDFEITVLSDGTAARAMDKIMSKPDQVRADLTKAHEPVEATLSINAYLINTGEKLILVDTGAGELFGPDAGHLVSSLQAAGYSPEQIDVVLLTHIHADHSGGLTVGGERIFKSAPIYVDKRDSEYWFDRAKEKAAPAAKKLTFTQSRKTVGPYVKSGQLHPFDGAAELFPGIHSLSAYGHTPGHTAYLIESHGKKLLLWGDIIHFTEGQFSDPAMTVAYDADPEGAVATRIKMLTLADKEGYLVGSDHISFPGLGHVSSDASGFHWVPLSYGSKP